MPRRRRRRTRKPLVTVGGQPLTRELADQIVGKQDKHFDDRPMWEIALEQLELCFVFGQRIEEELESTIGELPEPYAEFDIVDPPITAKEAIARCEGRADRGIVPGHRSPRKQNRSKSPGRLRARMARRAIKQTGIYPGMPLTIAA